MDGFLKILDHACTTCFVLQMFWKFFSKSFACSQRYMNKILWSIFKIWNFLPLFQMLFLWPNKTPPQWNPPLSVQEGFRYRFWRYYSLPLSNTIRYQIENTTLKTNWKTKILKLVVVWSFCFGLILSPPLVLIAKNGDFVSPIYFLPHWYK